jgi:hypothetical protein
MGSVFSGDPFYNCGGGSQKNHTHSSIVEPPAQNRATHSTTKTFGAVELNSKKGRVCYFCNKKSPSAKASSPEP